MKLQVLQENLAKAVYIATKFTSSRVQLPVLGNILLTAEKNKLMLSATNLEMSINLSIGAKVEKEGEITVPARVLNEIVSNLRKGPLNITVDKEKVKISNENFNSNLAGMNSSDFPAIPKKISKQSLKFESTELTQALNKVLYAVSTDETRPSLTGVYFLLGKTKTTLVATDGYRLSKMNVNCEGNLKSVKKLIIPKMALSEILSLLQESNDITFSFDEENSQVIVSIAEVILSTRVIQGDFPDYEKIIPTSSKTECLIDKEELLQSVKLASVFARDSANIVKFSLGKDSLEVTAESQYSGNQKTKVDTKIKGGELKIAFNYRFLQEFLQSVKGDEVLMKYNDANSPGVFLEPKDDKFLHLIMPVKLQE